MSDPRLDQLTPLQRATFALKEARMRLDAVEAARREPLAIVGMACRFPGADDPAAFWRLLRDGVDAITDTPAERWDVQAYFDPRPGTPARMHTLSGGFLAGVDRFDARFFGISPREAAGMDPQQRLLLEVAWEALENAGIAAERLNGSPTGVFLGLSSHDYAVLEAREGPELVDPHYGTGVSDSVASGRLSYVFGFQGPSLSIDTACSSSLVALHLACQSLRRRECNLALAGGVNLIVAPESSIYTCQVGAIALDGRCRAFSAAASGTVRGEGAGIVVLKRLSDALADGDPVLALVRGTAVNQDGRSNGLTAPNGLAQQQVVRLALEDGGVAPAEVGYVEAHGTGTPFPAHWDPKLRIPRGQVVAAASIVSPKY